MNDKRRNLHNIFLAFAYNNAKADSAYPYVHKIFSNAYPKHNSLNIKDMNHAGGGICCTPISHISL